MGAPVQLTFIPAITVALLSVPALAQEYQAVTADNAIVRNAPGPDYGQQGTIPAGTAVAVEICFKRGAYCKVHWQAASGFVSGSLLSLGDGGRTVSEAEAERWAIIDTQPRSRMPTPRLILTPDIRMEGDSFIAGAYGAGLAASTGKLTTRQIQETALGGSTLDEAVARILSPTYSSLLGRVTIFWDGSENGLITVDEYLEQLQTAVDALGHDRFIVIGAAANYREDQMKLVDTINDQMLARWPENFLDWRSILLLSEPGGYPAEAMFANLPTDTTHLSAAAMDLMSAAVVNFIDAKGW